MKSYLITTVFIITVLVFYWLLQGYCMFTVHHMPGLKDGSYTRSKFSFVVFWPSGKLRQWHNGKDYRYECRPDVIETFEKEYGRHFWWMF
jgi:hypothetical protein